MAKSNIEQKALDLLSMREHSKLELSRKLASRGFERDAIDAVLDKLEAGKYLSEDRFVENYISHRAKRGYGPVRIRLELRERGIKDALIETSLDETDIDWYASAIDVKMKKFGSTHHQDFSTKAKVSRFLDYRGFDSEQIRHAVEYEDTRD